MTGACALIPAAGRGVRFGSPENKVFAPLRGRPLIGWTLDAFARCAAVDSIFLIGGEEDLDRLRGTGARFGGGKVRGVLAGGADRQASVAAGLAAIAGTAAAEWVVVHDAARPGVSPELIAATLGAAAANGAGATAAVPVADTLIRDATGETVDREGLWAVQTPQAFRVEILVRAHRAAERDGIRGTDDAGLVRRMSLPVALVPGDAGNLKVTRPADLDLAAAVLARRDGPDVQNPPLPTLRVGHGYDVHPFSEGRKLFLGGVEFPEAPRGLLGHSDADVLLHALCDALLGAAGMGDIGALFPDNDPAHKDRPSVEFLRAVRGHLDGAGFRVGNVDMTVLAETPRVGPRAGEIKACVAGALGVAPDQVGLKATTNEGMGFVGRGEGIAAYATALIYR